LSWGDPVNRDPMLSERYSRLAMASLWSWISARIRASAAAKALFWSGDGLADPARTIANTTTQQSTGKVNRREFIRSPSKTLKFDWFESGAIRLSELTASLLP
jgi:hypothetical protein